MVRERVIAVALAALIGLGAAKQASATSVSFDFTGLSGTMNSVDLSGSGVNLSVTAQGGGVSANNKGFGVSGYPEHGRLAAGESLVFDFGTKMILSLTGLIFESGAEDERFSITVDGVTTQFVMPGNGDGVSKRSFDFSSLFPAGGVSIFSINGEEPSADGSRGIRVSGLEVVTSAPIPAAIWMMLPALGGMYLVGRRRRKDTA